MLGWKGCHPIYLPWWIGTVGAHRHFKTMNLSHSKWRKSITPSPAPHEVIDTRYRHDSTLHQPAVLYLLYLSRIYRQRISGCSWGSVQSPQHWQGLCVPLLSHLDLNLLCLLQPSAVIYLTAAHNSSPSPSTMTAGALAAVSSLRFEFLLSIHTQLYFYQPISKTCWTLL